MKEFQLVDRFLGYRAKHDDTKLDPGFLVAGSKNVLINDAERIEARGGYTLDGAANATSNPIVSSFVWKTHRGVEIPLRSYDDELEFRTDITGTVTWHRLADSWAAIGFNFDTVWDDTEKQDIMLFVNGDSNIYDWSGGIATFASATASTITLEGTLTWAERGFLTNGSRSVIIEGTAYTYTGGENTTTLTGVSPDPSAAGHTVGAIVHQSIRTNTDKPDANFDNDLIKVLNNQVFVGDLNDRQIYVSKNTDFTDFTFTSPRIPGDGALITLDEPPTGFVVQEDSMYISSGSSRWMRVELRLGSGLENEELLIPALKSHAQGGAQSQSLIENIKNNIVFVSFEPVLNELGRVEQVDTPQSRSISDIIKAEFDIYDFTNGHIRFWRDKIYIALPSETLVLIYDIEDGRWEAPQELPIRRLEIIDDVLYGHSSLVPETYKLFDGRDDNGAPIDARARFSYMNGGNRAWQKNFDEWFTEGYISPNTELTLKILFEFRGAEQQLEFTIDGSDEDTTFGGEEDANLGVNPLGDTPFGDTGENQDIDIVPPKLRIINTTTKRDYYEIQAEYSSYGDDQNWQLLAFGPNSRLSTADNVHIKK